MNDKLSIQIHEYKYLNLIEKKYSEKQLIDYYKDKDNDTIKLKNEEITEFKDNYYCDKKKILLIEKISFFFHIFIGIIALFHSFHFILSEYVRNIKNYFFFSFQFAYIYFLL